MSWYLANENKILDQFASGQGLSDLRKAIEANSFPDLQDFIDEGVTASILPCIDQLNQLVHKTRDEDVKITAQGLAKLMHGQTLVMITQGFEYEDEGEEEPEDEHADSLKHPKPAKPIKPTVRKAKKKAEAKKKPIAGKAKKKAPPKKDRAWFERKVAELKTELEKLPADQQEQLRRELKDERDRKQ
jgi:hypothetical protein